MERSIIPHQSWMLIIFFHSWLCKSFGNTTWPMMIFQLNFLVLYVNWLIDLLNDLILFFDKLLLLLFYTEVLLSNQRQIPINRERFINLIVIWTALGGDLSPQKRALVCILTKDVFKFILKKHSHLFFCLQLLVSVIIFGLFCFKELGLSLLSGSFRVSDLYLLDNHGTIFFRNIRAISDCV